MKLKLTRPRPLEFVLGNLRYANGGLARWRAELPLWLRGFTSEQIALYGLEPASASEYLPDFYKFLITSRTNRNVWPILHDKLLFDAFAGGRLPTSRLLGMGSAGTVTWLTREFDEAALAAELGRGQGFVVKPLRGGGGVGLTFIEPTDDGRVSLGRSAHDTGDLLRWLKGLTYHGIYRREAQHGVLAELYPRTTNTIRVTMFRRDGHDPRVLDATLRVGVRRSEPVDNTGKGAVSVRVDETGTTTAAHVRDSQGAYTHTSHHPDTGQPLIGVQLPYWSETIEILTSFHGRNLAFDLVGWDVLITPTGPLVIEGNHNPHLRSTFLHGTFSERPEFLAFCREKGLLDRSLFVTREPL